MLGCVGLGFVVPCWIELVNAQPNPLLDSTSSPPPSAFPFRSQAALPIVGPALSEGLSSSLMVLQLKDGLVCDTLLRSYALCAGCCASLFCAAVCGVVWCIEIVFALFPALLLLLTFYPSLMQSRFSRPPAAPLQFASRPVHLLRAPRGAT